MLSQSNLTYDLQILLSFLLSYLITTELFSDEESNTSTYREDSSRRPSSDDDAIRFGFCVSNFLSILSDFFSQEKLTQK